MAQAIFNMIDNNPIVKEVSQASEKLGGVNFQDVFKKSVDESTNNSKNVHNIVLKDKNIEDDSLNNSISNFVDSELKEVVDSELKEVVDSELKEVVDISQLIKETCSNEDEAMNDVVDMINVVENTLATPLLQEINVFNDSDEVKDVDCSISSDELVSHNVDFPMMLNATNEIGTDVTKIDVVQIEESVSDIEYKQEDLSANDKTLKDIVEEKVLKELNLESIEVETADSEGDELSYMQQSPEEQSIKLMIQNDISFNDVKINVDNVIDSNSQVDINSDVQIVSPSKIIEQITKQMENVNSLSKINIVLNPESLGKVVLQLARSVDGLSAQFTVATNEAKEILMKNLDSLKENLLTQGVSVDNVSVKMNEIQKSEYNQDWTEQEGSRGGNKENQKENQKQRKNNFEEIISQENDENGKV